MERKEKEKEWVVDKEGGGERGEEGQEQEKSREEWEEEEEEKEEQEKGIEQEDEKNGELQSKKHKKQLFNVFYLKKL